MQKSLVGTLTPN